MFDHLFTDPRTLARQRQDPLADERQRYLVLCAEQRMARTTLQIIAFYTLVSATVLRLAEQSTELITADEIQAASDDWASHHCTPLALAAIRTARRQFTRYATRWLSFLGRLQPALPDPQPYAEQGCRFADHLRQARGLSPRTIANCCLTVPPGGRCSSICAPRSIR
jgi:hypothetical protein